MSSGEIIFSFLAIRDGCPGENLWIQGQLSVDFMDLGVLTPTWNYIQQLFFICFLGSSSVIS